MTVMGEVACKKRRQELVDPKFILFWSDELVKLLRKRIGWRK